MQLRVGGMGLGSEMMISYGNGMGFIGIIGGIGIRGGDPSYAVTVTVAVLLPASLVATKV